jgi:hypothetical protein
MREITIEEALRRLRANYQNVDFTAGELSEGFWIRAVQMNGNWSWERFRMTSPGSMFYFAQVALSEFYGA